MGNFYSVICANRENVTVKKRKEKEEIEETPVVEIHINCPSNTVSFHTRQELRQETEPVEGTVSCSVEALDIESDSWSDGQSSLDTVSFQSENECDVTGDAQGHLEEAFSLDVRGKSCLPRNMKITGLSQQNNDVHSHALAPVERPACWRNESHLPQGNSYNGGYSYLVKEHTRSSGLHSAPKISLPPPRPSQWQWVYSKILKPKEQQAEESLKKKQRSSPKKKSANQEEETRTRSSRHIKETKKSIRLKAAEDPNCDPVALPTDEAIGVDVEATGDSSQAGARSSSHALRSITYKEDLEEATLETVNKHHNGARSRKFFQLRNNKVVPH